MAGVRNPAQLPPPALQKEARGKPNKLKVLLSGNTQPGRTLLNKDVSLPKNRRRTEGAFPIHDKTDAIGEILPKCAVAH